MRTDDEGYTCFVKEHYEKKLKEMNIPICGEWCLFNSLACGCDTKAVRVLNGVDGARGTIDFKMKKNEIYRAVADAQLQAWQRKRILLLSYKLLTDTINETDGNFGITGIWAVFDFKFPTTQKKN